MVACANPGCASGETKLGHQRSAIRGGYGQLFECGDRTNRRTVRRAQFAGHTKPPGAGGHAVDEEPGRAGVAGGGNGAVFRLRNL